MNIQFPEWLIDILKQAPIALPFMFMWWTERTDRIKQSERLFIMQKETIQTGERIAATLSSFKELLRS